MGILHFIYVIPTCLLFFATVNRYNYSGMHLWYMLMRIGFGLIYYIVYVHKYFKLLKEKGLNNDLEERLDRFSGDSGRTNDFVNVQNN